MAASATPAQLFACKKGDQLYHRKLCRIRPSRTHSEGEASLERETQQPFFSIVIALWNREDTIQRCLNSILRQDFSNYEIIVVDDASTDKSLATVSGYLDKRLRLLQHHENRGAYTSRATGAAHARGQWVVKFDSDDVLLEHTLASLFALASEAPDGTGVVGMSYRYDDGTTGPHPPFPPGDVGLDGWLAWCDSAQRVDFLTAFRRQVLQGVPFPTDGRGSVQMMMRIAARWQIRVASEVGGVVFTDAPNRLSVNKATLLTPDQLRTHALASQEILTEFGHQLRAHAPNLLRRIRYDAGWWHLLAGHRVRGAAWMLRYLVHYPLDVHAWAWLALGLLGPRAIGWARNRHRK